ncbi:MAG: ABC transporter permease [Spirochaetia bacterium]
MIGKLGFALRQKIEKVFYGAGFFLHVLKDTALLFKNRQVGYKVLTMQILFTGFEALGIITILAVSLGAVIIIQGLTLLPQFGQGSLIYSILITVITRELGPVLTAFIIIARSGTAIATEMGNMVVNHEIEAYISVGINPISYLVVPRFLGVVISMVILNMYFNIFGLLGSFLITQLVKPISFAEYSMGIVSALKITDILASFIKSILFGTIISVVSTYQAFQVDRASTEIPQRVIKAVGQSVILCILADAVVTLIYYI